MSDSGRIRVCSANPRYWQMGPEPTLLLGGSVEDNLFQIPDLAEHLDLLRSVGGNYVRCTMSCRDEGNVWPFARQGDKYDLEQWNHDFWERFETFLELTEQRGIVAQVEVWATFDFYPFWGVNPWNPDNNVNYGFDETMLPKAKHLNPNPPSNNNAFFFSVPSLLNARSLLRYQQRFVDKLLEHALPRGNVLYCMDNETHAPPAWAEYWMNYILERAEAEGVDVCVTEMYWQSDLRHPDHWPSLRHGELYDFFEASQNGAVTGQDNADHLRAVYEAISPPRPINNVKIYGSDEEPAWSRSGAEACDRFWRAIFGGSASARFHRPTAGLGLSDRACANLRSMRMLTDAMDWFRGRPCDELLRDRPENAAYCFARPGAEAAVYFTGADGVSIDLSAGEGDWTARWLDIPAATWAKTETLASGPAVKLNPPGEGNQAVLIQRDSANR
jgi:hypothetical protein